MESPHKSEIEHAYVGTNQGGGLGFFTFKKMLKKGGNMRNFLLLIRRLTTCFYANV